MTRKQILALTVAAGLLVGCSGSGVTIRGEIAEGGKKRTIVVERIVPAGARFVDSVRTCH